MRFASAQAGGRWPAAGVELGKTDVAAGLLLHEGSAP
jgi:hypothetical protein